MYEIPTITEINDSSIESLLSSIISPDVKDGSYYNPAFENTSTPEQRLIGTSAEYLADIIANSNYQNYYFAHEKLVVKIENCSVLPQLQQLQQWVETQYPDYTFSKSNAIVYPPTGCLGWHTNANRPGLRFYLHWVEDIGQSSFKYWNGTNVINDVESMKTFARIFNVTEESNPIWHCVYSNTWRVSVGFYMEQKK